MIKRNWKTKSTAVATILLGISFLMGGQAYAATGSTHHHKSHVKHHYNNNNYQQNDEENNSDNNQTDSTDVVQMNDNNSQQADDTVDNSANTFAGQNTNKYKQADTTGQPQFSQDFGTPAGDTVSSGNAGSSNLADAIIADGLKYKGTPYKFGSSKNTTSTFDCSSFTQHVFKDVGITLPRDSRQQSQVGTPVSINNLQKGDLIFFRSYGSSSSRITHVAIYAGNDTILHTYGKPGVTMSKFFGTSWEKRFVTARRVI